MLSQLYLSSAVLKYYNDNGCQDEDVDYVVWCLQYSLQRIQSASRELFENFPQRWLGKLLGWLIFPFGYTYSVANDSVAHRMVALMLTHSNVRERLTEYCYLSNDHEDTGRRLDQALSKVDSADPIWKKLHKAVQAGSVSSLLDKDKRIDAAKLAGILDADESSLLREFEAMRSEIIKVNEFSFDLSKVIV
jgi:acyl-CoA dehydrogenase